MTRTHRLKQLEELEERMRATHQDQMEKLIGGYRDQFAKAKDEAATQRLLLESKVAIFQEELQNAQQRYDARAPRRQDLDAIKALEDEAAALRERAKVLQAETDR
jgi:hypothetical protein